MPKDIKEENKEICNNTFISHVGGKRSRSINSEHEQIHKKRKKDSSKRPKVEGITKSKLLSSKQKPRVTRISGNSTQPRVCGNGKPMPSLAELEKMFEDSDEELSSTTHQNVQTSRPPSNEPPSTAPETLPILPESLEILTEKISNYIDKLADSVEIIDDSDHVNGDVCPVKKRKKNEPYIIGCKERDKVDKKIKAKFGQGDTKYGVNKNDNNMNGEDESLKRNKRSKYKNSTTSIFNSKAEEIAEILKEADNTGFNSDGSSDSNQTLVYDVSEMSPIRKKLCNFSPIPSTSNDTETFLKNDKKFNDSLIVCNDSMDSDVEVIDIPCETILLDDEGTNNVKNSVLDPDVEEVIEVPYNFERNDDISLVNLESYEMNQSQDCEIIDVDDVIAETQAILKKRRLREMTCDVTYVPPQKYSNLSCKNAPIPKKILTTSSPPQKYSNLPCENIPIPEKIVKTSSPENKIANVISEFFSQCSKNNPFTTLDGNNSTATTESNNLTVPNPTILQNIMNCMIASAQALIKKYSQPKVSSNVAEIIDLSSVDISNNNPLMEPERNTVNLLNNDSVVFVSNSVVDVTTPPNRSQPKRRQKKGKIQKSTNAQSTPVPTSNNVANTSNTQTNANTNVSNTSLANVQNFGECPICFDSFTKTNMASTICGHLFCISCIKNSMSQSGRKCPNCRKSLKGIGYHKIYL